MALIQSRCAEILADIILDRVIAVSWLEIDIFKRPSGARRFGAACNINDFVCSRAPRDINKVDIVPDEC